MSITFTDISDRNDSVQPRVSHFDLLKATYGIGDTFTMRNVLLALFTGLALGSNLAIAAMLADTADKLIAYSLVLTSAYWLIGVHVAQTAAFKHKMTVLRSTMARQAWKTEIAFLLATLLCALISTAIAVEIGGMLGFAAGLATLVINPIARLVPNAAFKLRIWQQKRQSAMIEAELGRKIEADLREVPKRRANEGLGR